MVTSLQVSTTKAIENILAMIEREIGFAPQTEHVRGEPAKLINDCLTLLGDSFSKTTAKKFTEPVRTIHHLSCTGGTLITKCIAALPNTLILNEVDPLSLMPFPDGRPGFTPTDMVALLRQGDTRTAPETIISMFVEQMAFLRDENSSIGRVLVMRDHSHSQFLVGDKVLERPTVREMLHNVMPVRSIVTVRNPIDSYLSLQKHGWHKHFSPSTLEEYCRRYLVFLEKHQDVDMVRYEDFVADPPLIMKRICRILELDYSDIFTEVFIVFLFSGDSGRTGTTISSRQRRPISVELMAEINESDAANELIERLGYTK